MTDTLPLETYRYTRDDDGASLAIQMTISERLAREDAAGRILLDDGTTALRDRESEILTARGAVDREHALELLRQLGS
jgi:hypothetical protein